MITGISSAGAADTNAAHSSPLAARASPLSQPVRLPCHAHTRHRPSAKAKAGTTPARNRSRTDEPETKAYTSIGIDGGMTMAKVPAVDISAPAKGRL